MKQGIHPEYGPVSIRCTCGNVIETRSTLKGNVQVDICSACHPFFTGQQRLVDTAGRIDRFTKKFGQRVALGTQKRQKAPVRPAPAPSKKKLKEQAEAAEKTPKQEGPATA